MSLDLNKLQKVVELAGGAKRARCPACAESGQDRKGEHLRIYPDGKFGCCVFPGDRDHRKRIFALAGAHRPQGIKVRVAVARSRDAIQGGIFGRLGQQFEDREANVEADAVRTPRTGDFEPEAEVMDDVRTGRTGVQYSRVYPEKVSIEENNNAVALKEFSGPVRGVRGDERRWPHILADGTLIIPFDSPERFHWWKGGQSMTDTREEILELERKEGNGAGI